MRFIRDWYATEGSKRPTHRQVPDNDNVPWQQRVLVLWDEDDALTPDRERGATALRRFAGPYVGDALARVDEGDTTYRLYPGGWVLGCSCGLDFVGVVVGVEQADLSWSSLTGVFDELIREVANHWPMDDKIYPGLAIAIMNGEFHPTQARRIARLGHVMLHLAKNHGKLAALLEPEAHDRPTGHNALLAEQVIYILLDILRVCHLVGLSGSQLTDAFNAWRKAKRSRP